MNIKDGAKITIHYTGKLKDGTVFDSSVGKDPFEFTLSSGQVIKGFDEGVRDMELGIKKTINIPCAEAYGEYQDELQMEYPIEVLDGANVKPGQTIFMQANDGRQFPCQVKEVTKENLKVDFNHPLAGEDLTFDLELLAIN